jgi:hypothetical protein
LLLKAAPHNRRLLFDEALSSIHKSGNYVEGWQDLIDRGMAEQLVGKHPDSLTSMTELMKEMQQAKDLWGDNVGKGLWTRGWRAAAAIAKRIGPKRGVSGAAVQGAVKTGETIGELAENPEAVRRVLQTVRAAVKVKQAAKKPITMKQRVAGHSLATGPAPLRTYLDKVATERSQETDKSQQAGVP